MHKSERLHGLDGKKTARAVLEERLREAAKHIGNPADLTVQAFVDRYWNPYLDRIDAKPSTRKSYASILKNVLPSIGAIPLAKVTPLHIENFLRERGNKASTKTMLNELGLLQSIFSLAVENDLIDRSPVRSKHKPKVARTEKPIWSADEVRQILDALPERHRALFTCGACTGARVGELLALTWRNVSFEGETIKIQNSLWNGQMVRPKTDASIRVLHMGPALLGVLRRHWAQAEHRASTDLVFCKPNGCSWNPDVLRKNVLYPALDRLRLPRPARSSGFHRFRHSAGSFVNSQTGNMKLVQRMLGHSRFETTANIYTHALREQERDAAFAVEQAIL